MIEKQARRADDLGLLREFIDEQTNSPGRMGSQ
jgi:hypothetical protein